MKTKKMRGFTLIECIVALMILGISSLLLAQAYTQLMKITNMNNTISYSISQQMKNAENPGASDEASTANAVGGTQQFKLTSSFTDPSIATRNYEFSVQVYAVKPYKNINGSGAGSQQDGGADLSADSSGTDVRYLYFHG